MLKKKRKEATIEELLDIAINATHDAIALTNKQCKEELIEELVGTQIVNRSFNAIDSLLKARRLIPASKT
jgi:hypothetical protein